jgi:hypothetical protein
MAARENPVGAKRESKTVDFKAMFDPDQASDWCELIKDVVAMANSGGGTILIGVANDGTCSGDAAALKILQTDPAVVTDKIAKYTGIQFDAFTMAQAKRRTKQVAVISVGRAELPMVFEKPGTYSIDAKQQKTAFSVGSLYVRHGAKSAPATSADIARLMERHVQRVRRQWLSGVRKVVTAPSGSTVSVRPPDLVQSGGRTATPIRITSDPNAPGYQLIDPDKTHPWRQKELLQELNKSLPTKVNQYDLLAVRHLYGVYGDPNFVHKSRFGAPQYSPAFANWLLEQYSRDPRFFQKSREEYKRRTAKQT